MGERARLLDDMNKSYTTLKDAVFAFDETSESDALDRVEKAQRHFNAMMAKVRAGR